MIVNTINDANSIVSTSNIKNIEVNLKEDFSDFVDYLRQKNPSQSYKIDIAPDGNFIISGDYKTVEAVKKVFREDEKHSPNISKIKTLNSDNMSMLDMNKAINAYKNASSHQNYIKIKNDCFI